jgi:polyisoprenoid-binding protein YceI
VIISSNAARLLAQEINVELDPAKTSIKFTLGASLHTVHGTMQLRSGTIRFNPNSGSASGMIIADARSGDTGNKSRDRKMHREVLKSEAFPDLTFTPQKISGAIANGESTAEIKGVLQLLGVPHPITLTAPVHLSNDIASFKTQFDIPYVQWGLKNPSTFLLHVSDTVQIEIDGTGHVTR